MHKILFIIDINIKTSKKLLEDRKTEQILHTHTHTSVTLVVSKRFLEKTHEALIIKMDKYIKSKFKTPVH